MKLIPRERTALDGKVWWCVYDETNHKWSTILVFGKYKTKKECAFAINRFKEMI